MAQSNLQNHKVTVLKWITDKIKEQLTMSAPQLVNCLCGGTQAILKTIFSSQRYCMNQIITIDLLKLGPKKIKPQKNTQEGSNITAELFLWIYVICVDDAVHKDLLDCLLFSDN